MPTSLPFKRLSCRKAKLTLIYPAISKHGTMLSARGTRARRFSREKNLCRLYAKLDLRLLIMKVASVPWNLIGSGLLTYIRPTQKSSLHGLTSAWFGMSAIEISLQSFLHKNRSLPVETSMLPTRRSISKIPVAITKTPDFLMKNAKASQNFLTRDLPIRSAIGTPM